MPSGPKRIRFQKKEVTDTRINKLLNEFFEESELEAWSAKETVSPVKPSVPSVPKVKGGSIGKEERMGLEEFKKKKSKDLEYQRDIGKVEEANEEKKRTLESMTS